MSGVQIENGFRYPLSRFPALIPALHGVLTPLGDREAIRIARELLAIAQDSSELPWEALKMFSPRYFKAPLAVTRTTTTQQAVIDLVYHWADFGRHRHAEWSMWDAGIRVDLWTLDSEDEDGQYVYGRIVASSTGFHDALLAVDGFEDFSCFDSEDDDVEMVKRRMVWNRVASKSHFEWAYLPSRVPMMEALKEGWTE